MNTDNFREFIDNNTDGIKDLISAIDYDYDVKLNIFSMKDDKAVQVNPSPIMNVVFEKMMGEETTMPPMEMMGQDMSEMYNFDMWQQMLSGKNGELINDIVYDQYELVGDNSKWPSKYNEVVLVVDKNNRKIGDK